MRRRFRGGDEDHLNDLQMHEIDRIASAADEADPRRGAEAAKSGTRIEGRGEDRRHTQISRRQPRRFEPERRPLARRRNGDKAGQSQPAERSHRRRRNLRQSRGQRRAREGKSDAEPKVVEIMQQRIFDMQRPQGLPPEQREIDAGGQKQQHQHNALASRAQRRP